METLDIFSGRAHERRDGFTHDNDIGKEEWLTTPHILAALGAFDLDPCSPPEERRPWGTAKRHLTVFDNGLAQPWEGRVWCNPPYGRECVKFLARMADHANGIALTFARTETKMFQEHVFPYADAMLFLKGRLQFCDFKGKPSQNSAGAPSVLIAYGQENHTALQSCGLPGYLVSLRPTA